MSLNFTLSVKEKKQISVHAGKLGIIIHPAPETAGGSNKIELTGPAVQESKYDLNGTEQLTFGYTEEGTPIFATNAQKSATSSRIAKNGSISSKKVYAKIVEIFNLDSKIENFIEISKLKSDNNIEYFELISPSVESASMEKLEMEVGVTSQDEDPSDNSVNIEQLPTAAVSI